jgi:hypothetical protein
MTDCEPTRGNDRYVRPPPRVKRAIGTGTAWLVGATKDGLRLLVRLQIASLLPCCTSRLEKQAEAVETLRRRSSY